MRSRQHSLDSHTCLLSQPGQCCWQLSGQQIYLAARGRESSASCGSAGSAAGLAILQGWAVLQLRLVRIYINRMSKAREERAAAAAGLEGHARHEGSS